MIISLSNVMIFLYINERSVTRKGKRGREKLELADNGDNGSTTGVEERSGKEKSK